MADTTDAERSFLSSTGFFECPRVSGEGPSELTIIEIKFGATCEPMSNLFYCLNGVFYYGMTSPVQELLFGLERVWAILEPG